MSVVMIPSQMATEAARGRREETSSRLTTTLYDLMTALQDVIGPDDDALVVATMVHLLRSGRLTVLGKSASGPGAAPRATGMASYLPTGHRVENQLFTMQRKSP